LKGLATTTVAEGQPMIVLSGEPPDVNRRLPLVLDRLKAAGVDVQRIESQQPNLEHLFLQLTGRRLRD
jgi:hypothetical protein